MLGVSVSWQLVSKPPAAVDEHDDRRANSRLSASLFADAVGLLAVPAGRYKGAQFLDHPGEDPYLVSRRLYPSVCYLIQSAL